MTTAEQALSAQAGVLGAEWVWVEGGMDAPTQKVWIRQVIDLPDWRPDRYAEMLIAADNGATVYLNGEKLGHYEGWKPVHTVDVSKKVRAGRNLIAIEGENVGPSPAGVLALLALSNLVGSPPEQVIVLNESALATVAEGNGLEWWKEEFDSSAWKAAVLLTPADNGPWGRVSKPESNTTALTVPANFPDFRVPGQENAMRKLRQLFFAHFRGDLSNMPAFNMMWMTPASIWVAPTNPKRPDLFRKSVRKRLETMRMSEAGYVSCHQHEGLGHTEGWPFPLYTQSGGAGWMFSLAGMPYGKEFGIAATTEVKQWTLSEARTLDLNPAKGWSLSLTGTNASVASPLISVVAPATTWVRLKLAPGTLYGQLNPSLQWTTKDHPEFSAERGMAFVVPRPATPDGEVDVDIPIHEITKMEGVVTGLRINFGNTETGEIRLVRFFTAVDTRHNWNNANYLIAAVSYFNWTGDQEYLRKEIGRLRKALRYSMEEFQVRKNGVLTTLWAGKDGSPGLTRNEEGKKIVRSGYGIGVNYWDLLPFGGYDAYSGIYQFAAVKAMAELEAAISRQSEWKIPAPAAQYSSKRLKEDVAKMREAYQTKFWNPATGRFFGAIDLAGQGYDYGFVFVNNEAITFGLPTQKQSTEIMDWITGKRIVATDTSTGADIFRWRFGPRSTTVRNLDYYTYVWYGAEQLAFGDQVQDGGAVLGFTFYDLMARLKVYGPDNAWERLQGILVWFGEVQEAGGYRKYYAPAAKRGKLQGGGPPGGLGMDEEFWESILVPQIMTEGFMGLRATPDRLMISPSLPSAWPSLTITRISYRDWILDLTASPDEISGQVAAATAAGELRFELPEGKWRIQVTKPDGTSEAELDKDNSFALSDRAVTAFVAKRVVR